MGWETSIVTVSTPNKAASGFVVGSNVVLTVGHVVMTDPPAEIDAADVTVIIDGVRHEVERVVVHSRWQNGAMDSSDMALIQLKDAELPPPAGIEIDYNPIEAPCQGFGRVDLALVGPVDVVLTRQPNLGGFDMYLGRGLQAPLGVSGGPLVASLHGAPTIVGIIIAVATSANTNVLIGLPLLDTTFGALLASL